ncbi:potassium channel family protein [Anaerostipes sp. MSJ-23]|uniref:potassium channel family protein n=1 Tax=unclassified Anaerostipes TaxID=2635253 RepID=UPI001C11ABB3|nr:TrkA family potassium uptake protein [Anaerostipes sp. MSJ-23]MBU5459296.1 TrkA family potassium uptake protein [Anaerostipes sp. MSJ-23]
MKKSVAVLGLGKFGDSVARNLMKDGAEVLAIDIKEDLVREIADDVTCAVCADVSDREMMSSIGLEEMDAMVLATAEHLDASVMAVMIAKEIGVPYILAKADGKLKGEILRRVGADEIVYPEEEMGARIANNLLGGRMTDLFDLSADTSIVKISVRQEWVGKSLAEINFRERYHLNVIAIESHQGVDGAPNPNEPLQENQSLVLIGKKDCLSKLR